MPSRSVETTEVQRLLHQLRLCERRVSAALVQQVNALLFDFPAARPERADIVVVLGSRNCGYRVELARDFASDPATCFVVCGGGRMPGGSTEAEFMRDRLVEFGVPLPRILVDGVTLTTRENLTVAEGVIAPRLADRPNACISLITGGFHMRRAMMLIHRLWHPAMARLVCPCPVYGPNTAPDVWASRTPGRDVIMDELVRLSALEAAPVTP